MTVKLNVVPIAPVVGLTVSEIAPPGVICAVPDTVPARAVTVVAPLVTSSTVASPFAFVVACVADNVPAVVEKLTGTLASLLPLASSTTAVSVTVPPLGGTVDGFALSATVAGA